MENEFLFLRFFEEKSTSYSSLIQKNEILHCLFRNFVDIFKFAVTTSAIQFHYGMDIALRNSIWK